MGREAVRIGANTFQFFTRNPRGGAAKALDQRDIAAYREYARDQGFGLIMGHASYALNPASNTAQLDEFVRPTMADDVERMEQVPGNLYNFHPGSRKEQSVQDAVAAIAATIDYIMRPKQTTVVCLETMSGKGSEVGGTFEELAMIIKKTKKKKLVGVCLDTCHVFDAGYDIVNELDAVLEHFDKTIGLDRLKAIHLNDSKNSLGSKKDRHEKLGQGLIGMKAFARIINHERLRLLPFYLETPNDDNGYAREIAELRKLYKK